MADNIRNICIIAHIDHGKSTLADRLLEITGTVEKRKMKEQYLDQLELERERGITIKMAPVRMHYNDYIINLIDTPGHPDFGYEVSRALEAVEGAILLVDATQGIQAQTLSNFYAAQKAGLTIIPAINKVDLPAARVEEALAETAALTGVAEEKILHISGKTGAGVTELLEKVVSEVRPPQTEVKSPIPINRALIFDSFYDDHKGIVAVVRMTDGELKTGDALHLIAARERIWSKDVGYFIPRPLSAPALHAGEIGFVTTGLKDPNKIKIGDTIINSKLKLEHLRLPGYKEPSPVVFVSFFPDDANEYEHLKKALERLRLNDSAFSFEPDFNEVLGRGFKGGFLGKLHFEIVAQRLDREFGIKTVTSFPSVAYRVDTILVQNPKDLPDEFNEIQEPYIKMEIVCPNTLIGSLLGLKEKFRWGHMSTELLGDRIILRTRMPLAELISDFDDMLKSISGGFASFSYVEDGYERGDLERLDILVADELVPGLSRVLPKSAIEYESRKMVRLLKDTLPRQQFAQAIQAKAHGRILARETIPAMRKDVTGYLYGGDRTRKMKLWKKQKEGKKKLLSMAKVRISPEDFKKLLAK
ncbi:elongation factor 4 [Candidatus Wolfebacteria bacterium RIFCSPHIGHO2_01_FULL_48_22]|uniref:Elongation factor 4 n=2 Tax=Candidatus Wolfeibacteriota TaxID=1752735 RepID=A0A1F8DT95_9BACT|nr:MAG: elongation factor 4 [Candidatus Wolfebacteria bacterium RIFCSPHIGHO2_01_FULL_48_22]OGM94051.1 MAG: elongation factor 4 [Candidatus Wolfebacteria bacterium RIFCSPLOWO2_01_FULL_47_17b]